LRLQHAEEVKAICKKKSVGKYDYPCSDSAILLPGVFHLKSAQTACLTKEQTECNPLGLGLFLSHQQIGQSAS
jgi:hypothetical protein